MKPPLFRSTDIFDFVQTKDQAASFIINLDTIISFLYKKTYTVEQILSQQLAYDKKEKLIALCNRFTIDINNSGQLEQFLMRLKDAIASYPVLIMRVGFEPPQHSIQIFSRWLATHTPGMLLDITVDKKVVGGAVLGAFGLYKDYSLRTILLAATQATYSEKQNR